jgi:hypothetical protein
MTDVQLDVLVASISPVSDRTVAALSLGEAERELLEAILALPQTGPGPLAPADRRPSEPGDGARVAMLPAPDGSAPRHRHRRVLAALGVAAALLVAAVVWQRTDADRPSDVVSQEADEPAGETADGPADGSNDPLREDWPKLVIDRPGWAMASVSVDGEQLDRVHINFTDGPRRIGVSWVPQESMAPDNGQIPESSRDELGPVQVLGQEALLHQAHDSGDYYMATWYPEDGHVMWASGFGFATSDEFVELLSALRPVDPAAFYAARPADHIGPDDQPAIIDELVTGVPTPPGFEASPPVVSNGGMGVTRVVLARAVVDSVICGWAKTWDSATDAGDAAGAQEAAAAMTMLAGWPAIDQREMSASIVSSYRRQLSEAASEMTAGRVPDPSEQQWEDALGCE